ncbi:hypothetical protein [Rosenbergiella epipactidis]|uniref:hypothetical protein n=1 Tax=Rosenbergiella epipactidis TaxID=1544694 RepID=UPI001F4DF5FF|nr:hypothetical protein [Rosenbergiella epipactidis]
MIDKIKDNVFRIIYALLCLLICVGSWHYQDDILSSSVRMLVFSYYASVATVIALIIAVLEIFYAIKITKSIQQKTQERIDTFKNQTVSHLSHVCSSYYESAIDDLVNHQYSQLSLNFRVALKLHRNIANNFISKEDRDLFEDKKNILDELEKNIHDARCMPLKEKISTRTSKKIRESLMEIKSMIDSKHTFTNVEG